MPALKNIVLMKTANKPIDANLQRQAEALQGKSILLTAPVKLIMFEDLLKVQSMGFP